MSEISRRHLLKAATTGGALAGIGGFSALSHFIDPFLAASGDRLAPFQAPTASEIDDASHAIQRLTFGPCPGQHAEVGALGARKFIALQLDPAAISALLAAISTRLAESRSERPLSARELAAKHGMQPMSDESHRRNLQNASLRIRRNG